MKVLVEVVDTRNRQYYDNPILVRAPEDALRTVGQVPHLIRRIV
jgi:hypothetical protein